eukprot:CAMPEP_0113501448 /NCGR_PEP_ID=MMETSP0014_2-20120614/32961_1 /TAXON_ID=2857 /ORGANISM="Nitzschia sp." /LENGTH=167 /DNA_ID=CAMNT_0000396039 /DNA_START=109 /DNA_END=612 /DNA_ORIENTATION=+ /assembly_acc=CAM_ASM_000159
MQSKTRIDVELGEVAKNEDAGLDPTVRDDTEDKTPSDTEEEEEEKTESKSSSTSNKSILPLLNGKIALFLILFLISAAVILAITLPLMLEKGDSSSSSSTSVAFVEGPVESESGQGFPSPPADQDIAVETAYPVIDEDERLPHYGSSLSPPDDATINLDGTEDHGLN